MPFPPWMGIFFSNRTMQPTRYRLFGLLRRYWCRFTGIGVFLALLCCGLIIVTKRSQALQTIARIDREILTGHVDDDWEQRLSAALWWYPSNHQARLQLGYLLARDERFAEAASALMHVPPASELYEEASFARAKALLSDGQYELGEAVLHNHVVTYPRSVEAWDLYYLLLAEQFRPDELIEPLKLRVLESRTSSRFLVLHLKAVAAFSFAQKAEVRLRAVDEHKPGQPCVRAALAKSAWLKGEQERARGLFLELLETDQLRPRFALWAAEFFSELQDAAQAKVFLEKIASPTSLKVEDAATYWFIQARILTSEGNHDEALGRIDKTLKIKPNSARSHTLRATILRRLKRVPEAIESNEAAARYGAADGELYRQSTTIEQAPPRPDACRRIAENLQVMGYGDVADVWLDFERALQSGAE